MTRVDSVSFTFERRQDGIINWGNLLIASGGAYKPPKRFSYLISFDWERKGNWKYKDNHQKSEFGTKVPMLDGSTATIEHLSVSTAKEMLGV